MVDWIKWIIRLVRRLILSIKQMTHLIKRILSLKRKRSLHLSRLVRRTSDLKIQLSKPTTHLNKPVVGNQRSHPGHGRLSPTTKLAYLIKIVCLLTNRLILMEATTLINKTALGHTAVHSTNQHTARTPRHSKTDSPAQQLCTIRPVPPPRHLCTSPPGPLTNSTARHMNLPGITNRLGDLPTTDPGCTKGYPHQH